MVTFLREAHVLRTRVQQLLNLKNLMIGCVNLIVFFFLAKWAIENISPSLLLENLRSFPLTAVVPLVIANFFALVFHGLRLNVLTSWSFSTSFQVVNLGAGLNIVLPFRLGDLARVYFAKRGFSLSVTKLLGTGIIEKFFDLSALGVLTVLIVVLGNNQFISMGIAISIFSVVAFSYISLLTFRSLSRNTEGWLSKIQKIQWLVIAMREDIKVQSITKVALYTFLIWFANVLVVFIGFSGFLPLLHFGIFDAVCLLIITALAVALPSAPAGLGVYEAGIVAYLVQRFAIESEVALACAIIFHTAMILPQIALTSLGMFKIWITKTPTLPNT